MEFQNPKYLILDSIDFDAVMYMLREMDLQNSLLVEDDNGYYIVTCQNEVFQLNVWDGHTEFCSNQLGYYDYEELRSEL